jgi:DUF438 domain-containing protein
MDFSRHTNRTLHDEHVAVIDLMARFESALTRNATPPDGGEVLALLGSVRTALRTEVERHFDFEERDLFPILEDSGEGDLVALLEEEHATVRASAAAVLPLLDTARDRALSAAEWQRLRTHGLALAESLSAHAQKEEMSMLPALEDVLDEEQDSALWQRYGEEAA